MNTLSAFIILGLILLYFPMAVIPVANVSSVASDTSNVQGTGGFIFGNLGLVMMLCLIATILSWIYLK